MGMIDLGRSMALVLALLTEDRMIPANPRCCLLLGLLLDLLHLL